MKTTEAKVLRVVHEVYTKEERGTECTAMYIQRAISPNAQQVRVTTKNALAALVGGGWLKSRQIKAGEKALGYEGRGRRPTVYLLIGKKAQSVLKAVAAVLG